jgi:hypothetical protein
METEARPGLRVGTVERTIALSTSPRLPMDAALHALLRLAKVSIFMADGVSVANVGRFSNVTLDLPKCRLVWPGEENTDGIGFDSFLSTHLTGSEGRDVDFDELIKRGRLNSNLYSNPMPELRDLYLDGFLSTSQLPVELTRSTVDVTELPELEDLYEFQDLPAILDSIATRQIEVPPSFLLGNLGRSLLDENMTSRERLEAIRFPVCLAAGLQVSVWRTILSGLPISLAVMSHDTGGAGEASTGEATWNPVDVGISLLSAAVPRLADCHTADLLVLRNELSVPIARFRGAMQRLSRQMGERPSGEIRALWEEGGQSRAQRT